ncbi:MAG: hypothetical protein QOF16_1068 [Actinomycetota bacterium]|jgi:hypothetical protein|nr:hypothetical protein [Actinomycetota bacterium]MEA2487414.1 hypothetical protein [Actinomycetota bacterium]
MVLTAILHGVNFDFEQHIDAELDAVVETLLDEDFQASLSPIGRLRERRLLDQTDDGNGRVTRKTRCVLDMDFGGMAQRFLGNSDPAWVETAVWDQSKLTWTWSVEPEVAKELLSADGTIELRADGSLCARQIRGRVELRVPIYGSRIEPHIVEGLKEGYDEEVERIEKWLAGR